MSSIHSQVVVGFDFTHSGRAALYRAISLATRAPFHVLHFVCVLDPHKGCYALPSHGPIDYAYAERVQQAVTEEVAQELRENHVADRVHFFVHARIGKPAEEILGVARDVGADLIVVGTKGLTGVERIVLGSVAEHVVREAGCTVEVARAKTYDHVPLATLVDNNVHHTYVAPHRYTYEDHTAMVRPLDWPLY
jgi:nucleotide-binding universal stress UspA family protein